MIELLNIPKECLIIHNKKQNLIDKIYTEEELKEYVKELCWIASIKPALTNVTAVRTSEDRYEEIQVLFLQITDVQELYHICIPIYKTIRYPCLLIIQHKNEFDDMQDKFLLSICRFHPGKIEYENNILHKIKFSHWMFKDSLSSSAKKLINEISTQLNNKDDLKNIYINMDRAIENFSIGGITRAHLDRLLKDMIGKNRTNVYSMCTPYKKGIIVGSGKTAKYRKRSSQYTYSYDTEDIWHAFMMDEKISKVIGIRRYRDIEDLIYSIDTRLEEYEEW